MASPRSCRILTISSSITRAQELAERITNSASGHPAAASKETATTQLPWTISNKYYTAPVHFYLTKTSDAKSQDATDVPACIYVFSPSESFKEEFNSLIACFEDSDFEVSIAVSVPAPGAEPSTDNENNFFEAFFGEHGFEYVNGHSNCDTTQGHDIDDIEDIPGIGRLVDALSTILWPSMIQNAGSRLAKVRSVVSVPGPPGEEDGLWSLLNVDKDTSADAPSGLQREMNALERWLEEGADDEKDPWAGAVEISHSEASGSSRSPVSGFDDNFSDFISAPAQTRTDPDPDLPSQAEIESMAQRIFMPSVEEMDDDLQSPFDLSRMLGALEAMKEEIAGITDEDEKRKAAAKVALGLVYGLDEG